MENLNICINTQTPLVQFTGSPVGPGPDARAEPRENLDGLVEGVDYRFSPGGVTRMVYPLVKRLLADGTLREAHWISLNPRAPGTLRLPGITLHNVYLGKRRMRSYGKVKEAIWGAIHGLAGSGSDEDLFWTDDFSEYAYYNRITAETIRTLDRTHDFDLFYIHDFQQLPIGHMLDTLKPKIFRWHIPFEDSVIPDLWKPVMGQYLNGYDIVVVSTDRYLSALDTLGFKGRALREYPYVDPSDFSRPKADEARAACAQYGVGEDDEVALVVARMDPSKGQDRALRALARVAPRHPRLKMVFVGNGSFSGSGSGLGLSKSAVWKETLDELARRLEVRDRLVFTGHVPQRDLDSFYERSAFTILPSVREGFGLVVVEGWLHRKPTVVTERAGVTELIREGWNGLLFDPERPETLAEKMEQLLEDGGELGRKLGQNGYRTSEKCTLEVAAKAEAALVQEAVEA